MMNRIKPLFACLALCLAASAGAEVQLPKVFGDHMVLQREMPVPVWGWAEPGEAVSVAFAGGVEKAVADAKGDWMVKLPSLPASAEGRELTVTGKNAVVFKDVLVGEVWLCGGQSNMESEMNWCSPEEGKTADIPLFRRVKAEHVLAPRPMKDVQASWAVCRNGAASGFTAAGYYFAKKLTEELKIPVGLLDTSWGGSNITFWIPLDSYKTLPELRTQWEKEMEQYRKTLVPYLEQTEQWVAEARKSLEEGVITSRVPNMPDHREFAHMYNGMVVPFSPYAIRGMLWYQGEYNANDGDFYFDEMRGLIQGWRKLWKQGDVPFYFVQLPNLDPPKDDPKGGDGWAMIRSVQTKAMSIPNTGMIVTIDVGEAGDIHPRNKQDVGGRLALWALAKQYGRKDLVYRSPFYKGMQIEDGKIRITFDEVGGGLMVGKKDGRQPAVEDRGGQLKRFAIAGEDQKWVWAAAVIDGDTVLVSSPQVPQPVAVRYAYSHNPAGCNLYNRAGLPASPFRTDNW